MQYISTLFTLSIGLCTYTTALCMDEPALSNGINNYKYCSLKRDNGIVRKFYQEVHVHNKSGWPIQARIEGFGVVDKSSQLKPYSLDTGGVYLAHDQIYPFTRQINKVKNQKTTTYRLYAHALIVHFDGNNNSEQSFAAPFDAPVGQIIITSKKTNQGNYQLMIEDKK